MPHARPVRHDKPTHVTALYRNINDAGTGMWYTHDYSRATVWLLVTIEDVRFTYL